MQGIAAPAGKNEYCKQMNMFFRKNLLTVFCCYRNVTTRLYQTMYAYHAHVFCIAGHAKDIGGMLQFRPLNILSQYVKKKKYIKMCIKTWVFNCSRIQLKLSNAKVNPKQARSPVFQSLSVIQISFFFNIHTLKCMQLFYDSH